MGHSTDVGDPTYLAELCFGDGCVERVWLSRFFLDYGPDLCGQVVILSQPYLIGLW